MKKIIYLLIGVLLFVGNTRAQQNNTELPDSATADDCVQYALKHYPEVQQQYINENITKSQIKTKLADWYPQIDAQGTLQHYFKLPTTIMNTTGQASFVQTGIRNNTGVSFGLTQNIFNRDALLAVKTKGTVLQQAEQNIASTKIDVVANVRKAFYDVLLTRQQIGVLNEDIIRLQKSLKDAKSRYNAGIVDNTDYKRAVISLNNSIAQVHAQQALLVSKYATLKQLMGYPSNNELHIHIADSSFLEREAMFDTLSTVDPKRRIEYRQLQTEQELNFANLKYQKWSFIPTLSGVAQYNLAYMSNKNFGDMFKNEFPNSFVGLQLGFPIFQGGKRTENIRIAEMQIDLNKLDRENLSNAINAEYENALAVYKGDLGTYLTLKENVELARQVYQTISLQYQASYKSYLDVTNAETDLRAAEINYANALYQLIIDKVDIQKSLGLLQY
ncbi:MAG: TolC family protein [Arachidicoccus sp.]|nr:TolC family protein [Arachidicoccus sp.]